MNRLLSAAGAGLAAGLLAAMALVQAVGGDDAPSVALVASVSAAAAMLAVVGLLVHDAILAQHLHRRRELPLAIDELQEVLAQESTEHERSTE